MFLVQQTGQFFNYSIKHQRQWIAMKFGSRVNSDDFYTLVKHAFATVIPGSLKTNCKDFGDP